MCAIHFPATQVLALPYTFFSYIIYRKRGKTPRKLTLLSIDCLITFLPFKCDDVRNLLPKWKNVTYVLLFNKSRM